MQWKLRLLCRVLEVSRSGYYAWKQRKPSRRAMENEQLQHQIQEIFYRYKKRYGSRRITDALCDNGKNYNIKRVAHLLKTLGLRAKASRKFKRATSKRSWNDGMTDLVKREFQVNAVESTMEF